jgi:hypothetical protein
VCGRFSLNRRLDGFGRLWLFNRRRGRRLNLRLRRNFDVLFFPFVDSNDFIAIIHSEFGAQLVREAIFDGVRMRRHRDAHVL